MITAAERPGRVAVGSEPPVVLVSEDAALVRQVEHLAASVGVPLRTVPDAASWPGQPPPVLSLVGADALPRFDEPAGGRVVVLTRATTDDSLERAGILDVERVVYLPDDETWLVSRLLAAECGPVSTGAYVIGVMGGRGGAGASVLAAAIARTAAGRRLRCVLVDADPLGGGSDTVLGAEEAPGLRWPDLQDARGRLEIDPLAGALPVIDGVRVVTWGRDAAGPVPPEAMRAVLDAAIRMADLVVVDVPRWLDRAATLAVENCHVVLLVVSADVQATAAAQRSAAVLRRWADDVRLVVRGPAPGGLEPARVARALDLPLAGWIRPERGLAVALERAEPPANRRRGPLAAFCHELVTDLAPATRRTGRRTVGR
jgi:secretion/DNA translocation related CpaE-like protein